MRLARSLLVRRCFYAVWLQRNNNSIPIRSQNKSPIPVQNSHVAPHHTLAFPNLMDCRRGKCRQIPKRHTLVHSHVRHTSLDQLLVPLAFNALDCRMKLLNQWVKPQLPSYCPHFTQLLLLQIRTLMHIGQQHGLPPPNITQAQIKRVKISTLWLLTAHSASKFLGVPAPHSDSRETDAYVHIFM